MKLSDIFKFKLFEGGDKANLKIVNENFEIAEQELNATNEKVQENADAIGNKVDKSKIANNLVTTEAGYALDARMGKALSESKENNLLTKAFEISIEVNGNTEVATVLFRTTFFELCCSSCIS